MSSLAVSSFARTLLADATLRCASVLHLNGRWSHAQCGFVCTPLRLMLTGYNYSGQRRYISVSRRQCTQQQCCSNVAAAASSSSSSERTDEWFVQSFCQVDMLSQTTAEHSCVDTSSTSSFYRSSRDQHRSHHDYTKHRRCLQQQQQQRRALMLNAACTQDRENHGLTATVQQNINSSLRNLH